MAARFNEPLFVISVAARLVEMHPQTLRKYEKEGLIEPSRTSGNLRLYSDRDIERLRQVKYLVDVRGLNLAGVQLVLELTRKLRDLRNQAEPWQSVVNRQSTSQNGNGASETTPSNPVNMKEELDTVLRMLGFIDEPAREERRDGRMSY